MTDHGNDTALRADEIVVDDGDLAQGEGAPPESAEASVLEDETGDSDLGDSAPEPTPIPTSRLSLAIQELQDQVASLHDDKKNLHDRLLRTAADYDNYKKRSRKELSDRSKQAEDRVVLDFLPVLDNLERALAHTTGRDDDPLVDGVEMVYKQFLGMLERYGIAPVTALGEPFDPEFHEAVQQIYSDEPLGHVCYEMQKGYRRHDRLVRPATVVVSKGPEPEAEAEDHGATVGEAPEEAGHEGEA